MAFLSLIILYLLFSTNGSDKPDFDSSVKQKQQYSYEPIFTTGTQGYNFISKEDKKDKKVSWGSVAKKLLSKNRKGEFQKLNDDAAEENSKGSEEWNFIHKPFVPSEIEDTDTESANSSKSRPSRLKKNLSKSTSSLSSLFRSFSSSSSTSEADSLINKLLDDYVGGSDNGKALELVEKTDDAVDLKNEEELPSAPIVPIENFSLCSDILFRVSTDSNTQVLDIFSDGNAPTCVLACLYYKIKNSKFWVRPEGRCTRLSMSGPGYGTPAFTDFACICNNGIKGNYRYLIVQQEDTLYHVVSKQMGTKYSLGTVAEVHEYVENNFQQYLKDFLKHKRGIDWKGMYEYVRDFRWIRHFNDDRPVGKYLSETLKQELDDIRYYWTVTLPNKLLKYGIHRTQT